MEQILSRQDVAQLLQESGCADEFARRFDGFKTGSSSWRNR